MREFCQNVRRRRSDDQSARRLRLIDVLDAGLIFLRADTGVLAPEVCNHLVPGDGGEGQRPHELFRRARHHDMRIEPRILQLAHQLHSLIRGDSTANRYRNLYAPGGHTQHSKGR